MSDQSNRGLIFDVGVCNGDDSAYYLHKGFRVVGIEASPLLLPALRERFAPQIESGQYELVGLGIAESEGEARFWICDDHPEWSSFDREIASRNGGRHHSVPVPTCRLGALIDRFGMPDFCKIDIEGNDALCLEAFSPSAKPRHLSIEIIQGSRHIERLNQLGYDRFKIISQRTFRQPGAAMLAAKARLPFAIRRIVTALEARLNRYSPERDWQFPRGSSGPFGDATHGQWLDVQRALAIEAGVYSLGDDLTDWHDIHATY